MSDEGKCSVVLLMWLVAFAVGMCIADAHSRAIGFMLVIFSTAIVAIYFWAEDRIDAAMDRIKKYSEDCFERAEEIRKEGLNKEVGKVTNKQSEKRDFCNNELTALISCALNERVKINYYVSACGEESVHITDSNGMELCNAFVTDDNSLIGLASHILTLL